MKKLYWLRLGIVAVAIVLAFGCSFLMDPSQGYGSESTPLTAKNGTATGVKNIILFIGDGMGEAHLELTRLCAGGLPAIDQLVDARSYVSTVNVVGEVTDSAAGGTAIATGYKTLNDWVSTVPDDPYDPEAGFVTPETLLERAEGLEMSTGLITDLVISDATPAVFAAHVLDRDFDRDITEQMAAQEIEVLFSGGTDDTYLLLNMVPYSGGVDASDMDVFMDLYYDQDISVPLVYGFFSKNEMAYTPDREEETVEDTEPTLPQMTSVALEVLDNNPNGFFLMVEAGANDWAGHARDAAWVVAELVELDQAVQVALNWVDLHSSRDETLIVLTADHETGGLELPGEVDTDVVNGIQATTEWMWGVIKHKIMSIEETLATYAGITLTKDEAKLIAANKEMGIADVLSARENVDWELDGRDEGEHTATLVPVYAWGCGAEAFNGLSENIETGRKLAAAIDGPGIVWDED